MTDIAKQAMAHVKRLCVEIGPRPVGSAGDHAGADLHRARVLGREVGCGEATVRLPTWEHEETTLELEGRRLEAVANWFSLPCDVTAAITPVRDAGRPGARRPGRTDRAPARRADRTGDHGAGERRLLIPGASKDQRSAGREAPARGHHRVSCRLDPAACAQDPDMPILRRRYRRRPGWSCDPRGRVPPSADSRDAVHGALVQPGWRAAGVRPERIVLCAHYDTVWGAPGAIDNASGVGVMLAAAQALADTSCRRGWRWLRLGRRSFPA